MNNKDIEKKINKAYKNATPDVLSSILEECEDMKGQNVFMDITPKKTPNKHRIGRYALACVLVLAVMVGITTVNSQGKVASTISLDVNPSLEIKINKNDRVLEVNALNSDAVIVLGDMNLEGNDLDVVVNALIGSMLKNGYINEIANSILISVDGQSASTLQNRLMNDVSGIIQSTGMNGSIVTQTLMSNSDLEKLADHYDITLSKAQLIQSIVSQNSMYSFENLVPLSIHELNVLLNSSKNNVDNVSSTGQASDKAYIGGTQAKEIALKHAGLTESQVSDLDVEMDFDNGVMIYEVEFETSTSKYEYEINAVNGDIVQVEKDGKKTQVSSSTSSNSSSYIGKSQAKDIALKHAGVSENQARDVEIDLEKDNGTPYYDIEFDANGYEYDYHIHALTGAVLKSQKEKDDSSSVSSNVSYIGETKAKQIALTHAGVSASSLIDYDFDLDDDEHIYELKLKTNDYEFEYEIHAIDGTIIHVEKERND